MDESSCQQEIAIVEANRYLLIPSFLVTMALYSYEYFKERKIRLIPPFDTLIYSNSNQKAIVFAFGKIFVLFSFSLILKEYF